MQPKISIVVPVYNVENYLSECLSSICSQTYTNLEIICVNDGSSDSSLQICQNFKKKDHRITVLSQKNQGISVARNTGIKHVTSDFISFVDSDDYVDPRYVEVLYNTLTKKSVDFCYCRPLAIGTNFIQNMRFEQYFKTKMVSPTFPINPNNCSPNAWGKLFKMDIVKQNDISFPVGLLHEDNYWNFVYCFFSKNYAISNEYLYYYRRDNSHSIMAETRFQKEHLYDLMRICCRIFDKLKEEKNFENFLHYLDDFFFGRINSMIHDYHLSKINKEFFKEIEQYLLRSDTANDRFQKCKLLEKLEIF